MFKSTGNLNKLLVFYNISAMVEVQRSLDTMAIQAVMSPDEWMIFIDSVRNVADNFPDILGVLAIGSLAQSLRPSVDFFENLRSGTLGNAYESIRNPSRRKFFPTKQSDLDLWICVNDSTKSEDSRHRVDLGGMALLEELASGTLTKGSLHWRNKKAAVFRDSYKKEDLYPRHFIFLNDLSEPRLAGVFKRQLEDTLVSGLPQVVGRIHNFFDKRIPGDFLEVRAFPQSLFNLRPDDAIMPGGVEDREPFPRIADRQWIGPDHASVVLYAKDQVEIYPFVLDGPVLGSAIHDFVISYSEKYELPSISKGGFMLKPDTLQRGMEPLVRDIIQRGISEVGGHIVCERRIQQLSRNQIEKLYPLLRGRDLEETIDYLQSGEVVIIITELPASQATTFKILNKIKGSRVADRTESRLFEGRIMTGGVRDLLPLPGDEDRYNALIPTILRKRSDPNIRFTDEQYNYYSRNLLHGPDNCVELAGLVALVTDDLLR